MDRDSGDIPRRKLLTSVGALGVGSIGGLAVLTEPSRALDHTKETGDGLVLDWAATRNGADDSGSVQDTGSAFTYTVSGLLPGDFGTLTVEMSLNETENTPDAVTPRFALNLTANNENSRNEPERSAGDTTPNEGELAEFLTVDIFYDTGTLGVDMWGARNGEQEFGEGLIRDDASGTLEQVASDLPDSGPSGVVLDANPGGADDFLTADNSVPITFGWAFPDAANVNVTQSDSVEFDLIFYVEG